MDLFLTPVGMSLTNRLCLSQIHHIYICGFRSIKKSNSPRLHDWMLLKMCNLGWEEHKMKVKNTIYLEANPSSYSPGLLWKLFRTPFQRIIFGRQTYHVFVLYVSTQLMLGFNAETFLKTPINLSACCLINSNNNIFICTAQIRQGFQIHRTMKY